MAKARASFLRGYFVSPANRSPARTTAGAGIAHQRHDPPKEKVDLLNSPDPPGPGGAGGSQRGCIPPGPQGAHHPVKALCGEAFEKGIRSGGNPDAVHHVAPLGVFVQHAVDGVNVVLEVGVHGYGGVAVTPSPPSAPASRAFW